MARIATEAAAALLMHACGTLQLPEVIAEINRDTVASLRVAEKLGLQRRGAVLHETLVRYSLTREEFKLAPLSDLSVRSRCDLPPPAPKPRTSVMTEPDWRSINRANWDERVSVHLGPGGYDLTNLRAGHGRFNPIDDAELPPVAGLRVAHLQCHFGVDSLRLVQRGAARVVGLDFSAPAIEAANTLAKELNLAAQVHFVQADLYDALTAIPCPHDFDMVFVTWGALPWLPDIRHWSAIVAKLLRPGGMLYLAEGHPTAFVFDDAARDADGMPGYDAPYFGRQPLVYTNPSDYSNPDARLLSATTYTWLHPMGDLISSLLDAGLVLERYHEHDAITWPMFKLLVKGADGLYRWPDKPWLPLAFSLVASKRAAP